ncbi:uncharacterized protein LOC105445778 isoform X2 [Strongylocentrotus purpuratus]|uniref:Uncharacterized protein n=1 Tax=Strongylocentrotus purpuratus TaxID=7668 RepID=A0A7M7T0A0_STRPU|nr:uncharacterized protein LOC105445778 isoform X2 [Strongylocentrotus purpuratus]
MESPRGKNVSNWKWGYVIVLCKSIMMFFESGIAKSFGVLISEIVGRLDASYASVGLVCSLPSTIMMLSCPVITFILLRYNHRVVAMFGGIICAVGLGACAFATSTIVFGLCLAFSGIGRACVFHANTLLINDYFPEKFVLMNSLSYYGSMVGIMVLPIITDRSLEAYGYTWTFLILGAIKLHVVACAAALRRPFSKDIVITKRKDSSNDSMTLIEEGMSDSDGDQRVEALAIIEVKAREGNTDIRERSLKEKTEWSGQEGHPTNHVQNNNASLKESDCINKDAIELVGKNETDSGINAEERKTLFLGNDGIDIHKPYDASDSEDRSGTFWSSRSVWESGSIEKVDATELGGENGSDTGSDAEERRALIFKNGETGNILQPSAASDAIRNGDIRGIFGSFGSILEQYFKPILQEHVFLVTLPVVLLHTYIINAWVLFLVPHAEQVGIIQSRAVLLASIGGIAGLIGRTMSVVLLAKQADMIPVYIITGAICSVTFLLDGFGNGFVTRACLVFVQGFCLFTLDTTAFGFLKIAVMKEDNFSTAYGINCAVFAVGLIASGFVTGALFDALHSYTKVFNIIGVVQIIFIANVILIKILLKRRFSSGEAEQ